jgi:hypothetical protein
MNLSNGYNKEMLKLKHLILASLLLLVVHTNVRSADGKLLATPGVSQVEGSAGGGIVPWAQLAGYASREQISGSGYCSKVSVDDFALNVCGVQANFFDRVEVSYAKQSFEVKPLNTDLKQDIVGAKVRLYGDLVYSKWPQISVGIQHKSLKTETIAFALGANKKSDTDFYIASSKLHLGAVAGYNWLWNVSLRHTQANQMGLLGFGGEGKNKQWLLEASTAVLMSRHIAIGMEFREKPDNLNLGEDHWRDVFVAWFPNKSVSVTAAWVDLGSIAAINDQTGWYLSVTGYL